MGSHNEEKVVLIQIMFTYTVVGVLRASFKKYITSENYTGFRDSPDQIILHLSTKSWFLQLDLSWPGSRLT